MKNFLHVALVIPTICFASISNAAIKSPSLLEPSAIEKVAYSKQWLRLVHYKKSFWGGYESEVDGVGFFFAKDGKTNPKAELIATIEAFSKDIKIGLYKQHPQCAFPVRYGFLKKELNLKVESVACTFLEGILKKFEPDSATLVFSSAYQANPASAFGHTFLRLNKKRENQSQEKLDILDYGMNFAAAVPAGDNGITFALFGLTGNYEGHFAYLPYYLKVNEYSDSESRDIWEYELSLTSEETKRLLAHTWEIESNSYIEYFFMDENCSYQILSVLEAVRPDWNLTNFASYVAPTETLKKLVQTESAIKRIKFRPSLRQRMLSRYDDLSSPQKKSFHELLDGALAVNDVNDPEVLGTLNDYLYFKKKSDEDDFDPSLKKLMGQSLVRRSKLGLAKERPVLITDSTFIENGRPDQAHDTFRLGVGAGVESAGAFQELELKMAFHDLLNTDVGYTRFSQIDFLTLVLRLNSDKKTINYERFRFLQIAALLPMTFFDRGLSWRSNIDIYSPKDYACNDCHLFRAEAGLGTAFSPFSENQIFYGFLDASFEGGDSLKTGFRFSPKVEIGSIWNPVEAYKFRLFSNIKSDLFQKDRQQFFYQFEMEHAYALSASWDVRASVSYLLPSQNSSIRYSEVKTALNYYF